MAALLLAAIVAADVGAQTATLDQAALSASVAFGESITYQLRTPWAGAPPRTVRARFGLPDGLVTARGTAEVTLREGVLDAAYRWRVRGAIVPGVDVAYWFEVETDDRGALRTPAARLTYADEALTWRRASEGQVEVWYHEGGPAFEAEALRGVRTSLTLLRDRYGVRLQRPTRVVLYASLARMQAALGGGASPWVGGAALSEFNVTVLHASPGQRDMAAVIAHELTHLVIDHATLNPFGHVPAWLHEGLATVVESAILERFPYATILANAVASGELVSLRGITGSFPASGRRAVLAYAQSNSLVRFIVARWGEAAVANLLSAYQQGVSDDEAVMTALRLPLSEL
ncbi:MAG: hypothetical protein FJ029_06595, partial [Actinobacteria bacterium]|nr:hypothetical protein [Actinomycetota bacterium]